MGSLLFEKLGNTSMKEVTICFLKRKKASQFGAMNGRLVKLALRPLYVCGSLQHIQRVCCHCSQNRSE